jgi:hypothetical protein
MLDTLSDAALAIAGPIGFTILIRHHHAAVA